MGKRREKRGSDAARISPARGRGAAGQWALLVASVGVVVSTGLCWTTGQCQLAVPRWRRAPCCVQPGLGGIRRQSRAAGPQPSWRCLKVPDGSSLMEKKLCVCVCVGPVEEPCLEPLQSWRGMDGGPPAQQPPQCEG